MTQEFRKVTVRGLTLDPATSAPIVVLRTDEGRFLPIWIGLFEANSIAMQMEGITTPRPMTHDLLRDLVRALGAEVTQAVVDGLRENTFHATVYLSSPAGERRLDARPSDAIALALRAGAPIFVTDEVLSRARVVEVDEGLAEPEVWRRWLDRIRPEDFARGDEGGGRAG